MERDFSRYAFPVLHLSLDVIINLCMCVNWSSCVCMFALVTEPLFL